MMCHVITVTYLFIIQETKETEKKEKEKLNQRK